MAISSNKPNGQMALMAKWPNDQIGQTAKVSNSLMAKWTESKCQKAKWRNSFNGQMAK